MLRCANPQLWAGTWVPPLSSWSSPEVGQGAALVSQAVSAWDEVATDAPVRRRVVLQAAVRPGVVVLALPGAEPLLGVREAGEPMVRGRPQAGTPAGASG